MERLRQTAWASIAVGILALLTCELPLILVAIGFGTLGTSVIALRPPPLVENIAIGLALMGFLILLVHTFAKWKSTGKNL